MLLSVVVVVHRHQAWVRSCLRSILDPAPADAPAYEVIVVDDAATDHSARIVAEVAAGDVRVRTRRLEQRQGSAAAREVGLSMAHGDYVWFVEAADLLLAGWLDAVSDGLRSRPDVLVVGEVWQDIYGSRRRPSGRTGCRPVLRDRIVRRDYLASLDRPTAGRFAEIPLAATVTARAARVERQDQSVYAHRLLPALVTSQWADEGDPGGIFDAYDDALARLVAAEATSAHRTALVAAMLADGDALMTRVPSARRAAFFARMSTAFKAHAGDAPPPEGRVEQLERVALARGNLTAYTGVDRAVAPLESPRRLLRSGVGAVRRHLPRDRRSLGAARRQALYVAERRRPLEPDLAVFAAYWASAYSCNPRAIFEKAREIAPWVRGVWVVKAGSEHVLPAGVDHVVQGSLDYYRLMARATYFVNNVNFPNDIVKRSGQVHVQTHHGTPLKTMGLDLVDAPHSSLGLNFRRLAERIARWDYSISANEFSTEIWERVYPSGTYESLETGYPRNDVLATATPEHRDRVRAELGVGPGQTAVLYTPTHREYAKEYVAMLDVDALAEALGPSHVVLMRAHYFYRGAVASGTGSAVIDVAAHPSIEDLSIASDVLVTDYSSLMFDYAVLDRSIVIYAPDWDTYRTQRGTYFDLMAEAPGAVATTQAELTDVLRSGRASDADSTARRAAFRARYCSLEDGRAAERVVRRLWPAAGPAPTDAEDS